MTIISLGFGTFAQQLLAVGDLRVTDRALNPGNIARSETWRSFTGRPSQGSISVPFDLKAATYGAIMTSKTQPLTLRCPTGNCTWPVTPSLAVCGACAQATVQASCSTTETGITNLCEVFTTSGLKANLSNVPESSMGTSFQVFPSPGFRWKNDDTSKAYVANFEMVGYQASSESTSRYTIGLDILASTPVIASECALWLCVKSYKNTMIAGSATQKVTEIFSEALPVEEGPAAVSKMSQSFLPLPPTMNPHPGANFTVTYLAKYSMQNFLRRLFSGNVTVNTASQESSADIVAAMWPATRSIDEWIENIAASMTDVIRTTNPEPNDYYNGSAVRLAYRVRWVWITLPVLLMLVSLLVLIVAMVQTRRSSVQAWKGSLLTLLFMTPEMNLQRMIDGRTSAYRGYEKAMGKTKIWIEKEDYNRWVVKKRS